jgi:hypothetical protein
MKRIVKWLTGEEIDHQGAQLFIFCAILMAFVVTVLFVATTR